MRQSDPRDVSMSVLFLALDVDASLDRGDAVHTRELARYLSARGNIVHLVTASAPGQALGLPSNVRPYQRPPGGDLGVVRACTAIARQAAANVIYERRLSPKIAFAVSRLVGIPFVVEVNGTEEEADLQAR